MNKDVSFIFEAYTSSKEQGICGQGCTCGRCPRCMPNEEAESEDERFDREATELEGIMKQHGDGSSDLLHVVNDIYSIAERLQSKGVREANDILDLCSDLERMIEGKHEDEEVPGTEDEESNDDDTTDSDAGIQPGVV